MHRLIYLFIKYNNINKTISCHILMILYLAKHTQEKALLTSIAMPHKFKSWLQETSMSLLLIIICCTHPKMLNKIHVTCWTEPSLDVSAANVKKPSWDCRNLFHRSLKYSILKRRKQPRQGCCLSHLSLENTGHIFAQETAKFGQMPLHISSVKIRFWPSSKIVNSQKQWKP